MVTLIYRSKVKLFRRSRCNEESLLSFSLPLTAASNAVNEVDALDASRSRSV